MNDLIQRLRDFTVDNGDHLFHPRECLEAAAALEKAQGTEKEGWRYADELKQQVDSLQQKVHLCAGYDRLEAALRKANARERPAFIAGTHAVTDAMPGVTVFDEDQAWQQYRCQDDTDWTETVPDTDT